MSIFTRIVERARGKALYDIHAELTERIPILRSYSDMAESGGVASMTDFYTSNVWVHKAIKVLADNIANLDANVVRGWGRGARVGDHPLRQRQEISRALAARRAALLHQARRGRPALSPGGLLQDRRQ